MDRNQPLEEWSIDDLLAFGREFKIELDRRERELGECLPMVQLQAIAAQYRKA